MFTSRRMGGAKHGAGEKWRTHERIILKWMLQEQDARVWTALEGIRKVSGG
jgi:hypothetical protein